MFTLSKNHFSVLGLSLALAACTSGDKPQVIALGDSPPIKAVPVQIKPKMDSKKQMEPIKIVTLETVFVTPSPADLREAQLLASNRKYGKVLHGKFNRTRESFE